MRAAAIVFLALVSCRRAPDVVIAKDPAPAIDAAPQPPVVLDRIVLHGRIVDLRSGTVAHVLTPDLPKEELSDGRSAFVLGKDGRLAAFDLATGAPRWSTVASCAFLSQGRERIFCGDGEELRVFLKSNGSKQQLTGGGSGDVLEAQELAGRVMMRRADGTVTVLRSDGTRASVTLGTLYGDLHRLSIPASRDAFCSVAQVTGSAYDLACHDLDAKIRWAKRIELARPGDPSGVSYRLTHDGPHHLVFSSSPWFGASSPGSVTRGLVVRLADGVIMASIEQEIAAVAERADGTIAGLVVLNPELRFLDLHGVMLWSRPHAPTHHDDATAVAHGDRVIIESHSPIATGVSIMAHALGTGDLVWTGAIDLPPISHSKYRNRVELTLVGDQVRLRGHESSVSHLHVFDAATGERRFHDARPW